MCEKFNQCRGIQLLQLIHRLMIPMMLVMVLMMMMMTRSALELVDLDLVLSISAQILRR